MRALILTVIACLIIAPDLAAKQLRLDAGSDRSRARVRTRVVPGDLCSTAQDLGRGATVDVDLCQAWDDYDPGAFGCSPCSLPGPEVVFSLDTQAGEQLRLTTTMLSGSPDVRLYLATDCDDPVGTCVAASASSDVGLDLVLDQGGTMYLYVDTTDGCGEVSVGRPGVAVTASTTWGALKAIYR